MRIAMDEVKNLLKSKIDFIWINTYEEAEFIKDLTTLITKDFNNTELYVWSITEGLKKEPTNNLQKKEEPDAKMRDPHNVIDFIKREQSKKDSGSENFFVLRDFHIPLESIATLKRSVRDAKEYKSINYNPIIVVAPVSYIPLELEKMIRIVNYDTASNEDIRSCVDSIIKMMNTKNASGSNYIIPDDECRDKIEAALRGLTFNEVVETIRMSIIKYNGLDLKAIMDEKIQLIQKSGVLDYKVPTAMFDDIGGNVNFKAWIDDVEMAMSEDATNFGCEKPKGYLSLGPPGTAKTYMAEALAQKFGVPFIKLEMSKIMDKLVGNSEKKIDQALRTVAACAPCVFLIDEVEKALGGIKSSNSSDSGTTARCFASILQFLQDNNDVFVVMTSNDVSQLPPELTRSGRLDAIWYFSIPTQEEREAIFKIHLDKTGKAYDPDIIEDLASNAENYTGAEIKNIVKLSIWKAFRRFKCDGNDSLLMEDILPSIKEVVPIYESSKEKIIFLEHWAKGRARYSSEVTDSNGFDKREDKIFNDFLTI